MIDISLADLIAEVGENTIREFVEILAPKDKETFLARLNIELDNAITTLEQDAIDLYNAREETITRRISRILRARGYRSSTEEHTRGHVDLTIRPKDERFVWLGEAKIYNGSAALAGGLTQLLTRYTTGRELCGMLIYFQASHAFAKMRRWRDHIRSSGTCTFLTDEDDPTSPYFRTHHTHETTGDPIMVRHMAVGLFYDPQR